MEVHSGCNQFQFDLTVVQFLLIIELKMDRDQQLAKMQCPQQLSDEKIMDNLLKVRHDHAKSLEKDYSHLFR